MTRRKFILKSIAAGSAIITCAGWLISRAVPRKFVRAVRLKKYPGSLRPLQDIYTQGKWSG
ncbi:hypothetical protein D4R52_02985 [bacterium]|nr:MAG: hypothetical protein D4R52_02985 [bacterium]